MPPRRRSDLVIPQADSLEESEYTLRVPDAEYLLDEQDRKSVV